MARTPTDSARLDRWAIWLSTGCMVHCVATTVLAAALSAAGGWLGSPVVHEVGLVLAVLLGLVAFGRGIVAHRRAAPLAVGAVGLALMAAAILVPHGESHATETLLTMAGVAILAAGHFLNRRAHA
jgi:hypothetical protein